MTITSITWVHIVAMFGISVAITVLVLVGLLVRDRFFPPTS